MTDKKDELVTKGMLDQALDAILVGMDNLFNRFKEELHTEIGSFRKEVNQRFDKVEADIVFIKRDIKEIKEDLSDTPSMRQHNELKARVVKLEKTN